MKQRICFIVNGYPTKENPENAFLQPVIRGLANVGYECTVIAPKSVVRSPLKKKKKEIVTYDYSESGEKITVYRPLYVSLSNLKCFGNSISEILNYRAAKKIFEEIENDFDVLYAHFWECGMRAAKLSKKHSIPLIVIGGESKIRVIKRYTRKTIDTLLPFVKGFIGVSTKCFEDSNSCGLLTDRMMKTIIPNGFSKNEFYPMNKALVRKELGINQDDKIAIFVGAFSYRKGHDRVIKAAEKVPGLKLIMVGSGEENLTSDRVIFSGRLSHDAIVKYLNAADFFVLPTLAEGCCNAIVEALACGLPVISSDRNFNYDVLDDSNSILVDPLDICALAEAMCMLAENDEIRKEKSMCALTSVDRLEMTKRVQGISEFIESVINQ